MKWVNGYCNNVSAPGDNARSPKGRYCLTLEKKKREIIRVLDNGKGKIVTESNIHWE